MPKINLNLDDLKTEKQELGEFLARPDAYSDPNFTKYNKRFTELDAIIAKAAERDTLEQHLAEARELALGFMVGHEKLLVMAPMYIDKAYFEKIFGAPVTESLTARYLDWIDNLRNPRHKSFDRLLADAEVCVGGKGENGVPVLFHTVRIAEWLDGPARGGTQ